MSGAGSRRPEEAGQATLLIVGITATLLMAIAMVVDASAAYLQRQSLDTLADGAALRGADLGAAGIYTEGLPEERLLPQAGAVRAAVLDYLRAAGAHQRYPGLAAAVRVDAAARSVTVTLEAPLDLPLTVPGSPVAPRVGASSTAAVEVQPAG